MKKLFKVLAVVASLGLLGSAMAGAGDYGIMGAGDYGVMGAGDYGVMR